MVPRLDHAPNPSVQKPGTSSLFLHIDLYPFPSLLLNLEVRKIGMMWHHPRIMEVVRSPEIGQEKGTIGQEKGTRTVCLTGGRGAAKLLPMPRAPRCAPGGYVYHAL